VKGVIGATSGYSGGAAATAEYELVSNGDTGPRGIGEDHLRSFADHLRAASSSVLLRRARSHAVEPSGARHRQPVSFSEAGGKFDPWVQPLA
jgi:hypothetical protein